MDATMIETEYPALSDSIEDIGGSELKLLDAMRLRYEMYRPKNYYSLARDENFNLNFREQLFPNNSHFFDEPDEIRKDNDELAQKYGFPTSLDELKV